MLRAGVAEKTWAKFGTFGVRLLGNDWGSKFDGYSVVVGKENPMISEENALRLGSCPGFQQIS
jgi:hypothetical protein